MSAAYVLWFAEEARRALRRHPVALGLLGAFRHQGSGRGRRRDHPMELPSSMIARKLGPALAAGCTMVIKLGRRWDAYSGFAWGVLCAEAGVPRAS